MICALLFLNPAKFMASPSSAYQHSRSSYQSLRHIRYHLRHWGSDTAPKIFMLHGWMDVGASFQFVVDALQKDWHVIAPDWRGYGLTDWPEADCYWFPDYIADFDAIAEALSPNEPINLVGHSMGGNVAMLYAGVRPDRVKRLVNLEGFGLPGNAPEEAPVRYAKWLDELRVPPTMRPYASRDAVAERLRKTNPRLTVERADFLVGHWAREQEIATGTEWHICGDPAHKISNPQLYRVAEIMACWRNITAPVLWLNGQESALRKSLTSVPDYAERLTNIKNLKLIDIDAAGHMLHHDQPKKVAQLIEDFLLSA